VSSLALDYTSVTAQAPSGVPYGFMAPTIRGAGKRVTTLQQKSGSAGVVYSVIGKLGSNAGPGSNNKVTGHVLSDLEIVGVSGGSHGLSIESVFDSKFENLTIRNCGGSGIYHNRVASPPSNDEYAYGITFETIRCVVNSRYGLEHGSTNAIGGQFINCDFTANVLGGAYVCPSTVTFLGCHFVQNGSGLVAGAGLYALAATGGSTNSNLTAVNCRFEKNSTVNGYDVEIDYCEAFAFYNCVWYSTAGAHCFGAGNAATGNLMHNGLLSGGYMTGDSTTATQQALYIGSDCSYLKVDNPRFDYNGFNNSGSTKPTSLTTNNGAHSSFVFNENVIWNVTGTFDYPRLINPAGNPSSGTVRFWAQDSQQSPGHAQWVARFPSGAQQVIASEPENGSDPGRITWGTAVPTTGTWAVGDVCFNKAPAASGVPAWSCTVAGAPGTWKAWGNLSA
jgi:hypothetical protein